MFQLTYSLLLTLAFIALLPVFAWQAIFNRKYLENLRERLGRLPGDLASDGRPAIWVHAVSVGETLAALPLVAGLRRRFPGHRIIFSTTTITGQAVARSRIAGADGFCYLPFDWSFSVRRALETVRPSAVILMESELWFGFLSECRRRGIRVAVANGRISDRSFRRSLKFVFFIGRLYSLVDLFVMQGEGDARRARRLGAPAQRVIAAGNIKYDIGGPANEASLGAAGGELSSVFGLAGGRLIVAGSTHEGEEEIVLDAFKKLRSDNRMGDLRLMVAPRHPERFDAVAGLMESSGLSFARRSDCSGANGELARSADCILLDSIGELASVYSQARAVFVGGSLVPIGGHNILEPALYGKPVIVGPHMENFRDIACEFLRRGALVQIEGGAEELSEALSRILADDAEAGRLGSSARRAVEENRGATERTIEAIAGMIER